MLAHCLAPPRTRYSRDTTLPKDTAARGQQRSGRWEEARRASAKGRNTEMRPRGASSLSCIALKRKSFAERVIVTVLS
jgi:hypothetical protein